MKFSFLILLSLNVLSFSVFAEETAEQISLKCDFTKALAVKYAHFKSQNSDFPLDSVNYQDPIEKVFMPVLEEITQQGKYEIVSQDIMLFSQAAIDGESIYETMIEHDIGIGDKLARVKITTLDLACYYRNGISLEQVKLLKSRTK